MAVHCEVGGAIELAYEGASGSTADGGALEPIGVAC